MILNLTAYSYNIMVNCAICEIFFPAPEAFYTYLVLSFIYLLILILLYSKSSRKPRSSIKYWVWYLFAIYAFATFASALIYIWKLDVGFCMIDLDIFFYTLFYAPFLYYILVKDSNKLYKYEESLSTNLDPSDTYVFSSLLPLFNFYFIFGLMMMIDIWWYGMVVCMEW